MDRCRTSAALVFLFGQGNIEFACLPYNELPRNAVPVYTAASLCGRPDTNTVRGWLIAMEHSFIRGRGAMKLRITPVFPVKRFAAVSAQNVKNVQFDYTNMPTYNTITK